MPAPADLNDGQIAFYATVATAIPVLLLGYVLELSAFARRAVGSVDKAAAAGKDAVLQRIETLALGLVDN